MSERLIDRKKDILDKTRTNAEANGFFLCPDANLLDDLVTGLAENESRYGYCSCPCRIASGHATYDADIVCPCEYRDADCNQFGMCFCGLFVSKEVAENPAKLGSIPERRPKELIDASFEAKKSNPDRKTPVDSKPSTSARLSKKIPVWRCTVCGYLAARERPPGVCPICKAKAERFEKFTFD